jgi:hypothetical protein
VIATPGHTLGSSSLHFAGHDALLPGDAISMTNPLKKIIGPTIVLGFAADARAASGMGSAPSPLGELLPLTFTGGRPAC